MPDQQKPIEKNIGKSEGEAFNPKKEDSFRKGKVAQSEQELERGKKTVPEKAKEIREMLKGKKEQSGGSASGDDDQAKDDSKKEIEQHAKDIAQIEDADEQTEKLVELAQMKDPLFAIKTARHLDNNYVVDRVHDELMEDKVHKVLVEKGFLKED